MVTILALITLLVKTENKWAEGPFVSLPTGILLLPITTLFLSSSRVVFRTAPQLTARLEEATLKYAVKSTDTELCEYSASKS